MQFLDKTIILDRELSDLDIFTLDFVNILKKHTKYVIVSGYVSILLGRARASEDIDLIIPKMDYLEFEKLINDLKKNDFYCLNQEENKDIYEYITDKIAVRFARNGEVIPNMEVKFAKNKTDEIVLEDNILIKINEKELVVSNLELQIAFKEKVLKSPKDLEDARHLRNIAKNLDENKIKKYEEMLNGI